MSKIDELRKSGMAFAAESMGAGLATPGPTAARDHAGQGRRRSVQRLPFQYRMASARSGSAYQPGGRALSWRPGPAISRKWRLVPPGG